MVSKEGFPVAYEAFSGNTFEGHTIIPVIKDFIERNRVKDFTVAKPSGSKKLKFTQTRGQKIELKTGITIKNL